MRDKLALTIALASFAVVTALGVGIAGADSLGTAGGTTKPATTGLSTTPLPSVQTPACSNAIDDDGDGLVDMADPDCTAPTDISEAPTPTTAPNSSAEPPAPNSTLNSNSTLAPPQGKGPVIRNQGIEGPGNGGGASGGVSFPAATAGTQTQSAGPNGGTGFSNGGSPTPSNPTATIAGFGPVPIGVPNFVINSFEIPPFLLPIYQACGTEYGIPWEVLASINKIETAFGTNLNVSSAGAVGWMQFLPSTWETYGVDANGDGRKDPYNPVDAICAAADYLKAAGGSHDLYNAILAYNHADWYAQEVLATARAYGKLPADLIGSLTGLTQGAHFPVAADARYADDISTRAALRAATPGARKAYGNAADVIGSSPTRRGIDIFSHEGAPIVAVNDGVIKAMGRSKRLGLFIVLEDAYGNRYTYAKLGQIVRAHHAVVTAGGKTKAAPIDSENLRPRIYALPDRPHNRGRAGLAGKPGASSGVTGKLQVGSHVVGGAVIAHMAGAEGGTDPHVNFSIRPVGRGAPQIDPKPILDGWKLLEATAIYRSAGKNPFARNLGVSGILLLSKEALQARVLADHRISIYDCGRSDIAGGQIDRRVLATLEYLVAKGFRLDITSFKCGHGTLTSSGNVSEHSSGDAVDIAAIDNVPVSGHQGPGTLTDALIKTVLTLQGTMHPHQVISLEDLPGPTSFALPDHADHVHIGYYPAYDSSYVNPFLNAAQGRIDQGVDYTGTGPIDAIGDARILATGAPGWPEGGGVLYQLLDGPRAGRVIFVYEGIQATVRAGEQVAAGGQIGTFVPGGSIEIGFADSSGVPLSHAVYHEGMVTPWGRKMASFLVSVGAPGNLDAGFSQLSPHQWNRLIQRLDRIPNPTVPVAPSKFSLPAKHGKTGAASGGSSPSGD